MCAALDFHPLDKDELRKDPYFCGWEGSLPAGAEFGAAVLLAGVGNCEEVGIASDFVCEAVSDLGASGTVVMALSGLSR